MTSKSKKILTEISAGELLDKISILEIKLDKIKSKDSQEAINKEYKILKKAQDSNIKTTEKIKQLFREIKEVNLCLWGVENEIRICEKKKYFDKKFTELSRAVYFNNDKRAKIKSEINEILDSNIKEIKQYADY